MQTLLQQFKQFWQQLGNGQRISLSASIVAIVLGFSIFLYWVNRPQFQLLYGGLSAKDVSDVVAVLEEQGIPYQLSNAGHSILVPQKSVYNIRMRLVEKGIPSGSGVGYEIFDRNYVGVSDFMQKTNYMRALQGELSRTISEVNSVRNARVMIVIPENKLLSSQANIHPTASVFIDTGNSTLPEAGVNAIRSLVANSVEGLKVDDVSVVDNHGKVLSEDLNKSGSVGFATSHIKMRENLENYFGKKIESMLHSVVGMGHVVARVSVDLETTTTTIVEEKFDPESQVVRSQTYQENSSSNNESNSLQGTPEEKDNAVGGQAIETNSTESRKNRTIAYDINKSTREVVATPGTIKKMTAAVFIAQQSDPKNPQQFLKRSESEMAALKGMVANALGIEDLKHVSLEEVVFAASDANALLANNDELSQQLATWGPVVKNLITIVCSILIFGIFLKLIKNIKPAPSPSLDLLAANGNNNIPLLKQAPSPEILNELIQQKTDNVSTALKNWMQEEQK